MSEKIQGRNDQERLLFIANKWGSTAKIPKSEIASSSDDGQTIITAQGTRVNDALLAEAVSSDKARAEAARAVAGVPTDVVSKSEVQAMIDEVVQRALAQKNPPAS